MGALPHLKEEKFAQEFVELALLGVKSPAAEAYKRAGYAPGPANARRLSNRKHVRARIQERFREALEYADVRPARIVVEIDRVGRANRKDFYDKSGKLIPIANLPRELAAAIAYTSFDANGVPLEYHLYDKNQANFTLLKHLGGLPEAERREVNIFNMLSIDDQRALAEVLELGVEPEPAGPPAPRPQAQGERGAG
jgi:Terminase small subunit